MLDSIFLEPEQEYLLIELVEAARNVPRNQRQKFHLFKFLGGSSLKHPGFKGGDKSDPYIGDIEALGRQELIALSYTPRGVISFDVTSLGFRYYDLLQRKEVLRTYNVETNIRHYLESDDFRKKHSIAYERWLHADQLLWLADSEKQFTTIGHLCREALQEFTEELINEYKIIDAHSDKSKTVARMKAILQARKTAIPSTIEPYIDALLSLWGTTVDLIQRQEHGAQKEGQPLVWEDARRAVFASVLVMYEVDRTLR